MTTSEDQLSSVLLAEDDVVAQRVIAKQLKEWGYEVKTFSDGSAAMMAIRNADSPNVAILDWEMPGMDGLEICQRVREGQWPIYIIMLTCHGSSMDLVRALEAGAHDYIKKPCDPRELYARLRVGERIIRLQLLLEAKVAELQGAARRIRELEDRL